MTMNPSEPRFSALDIMRVLDMMLTADYPELIGMYGEPITLLSDDEIGVVFSNDYQKICPLAWLGRKDFNVVDALREAVARHKQRAVA